MNEADDLRVRGMTLEVIKAILKCSEVDVGGERSALIDTTEVYHMLSSVCAYFIADHQDCTTPRGRREVCEAFAKLMRQKIEAFQKDGGPQLPTYPNWQLVPHKSRAN